MEKWASSRPLSRRKFYPPPSPSWRGRSEAIWGSKMRSFWSACLVLTSIAGAGLGRSIESFGEKNSRRNEFQFCFRRENRIKSLGGVVCSASSLSPSSTSLSSSSSYSVSCGHGCYRNDVNCKLHSNFGSASDVKICLEKNFPAAIFLQSLVWSNLS